MMPSAKGSTSFQNLCWKCYKIYMFNFTLLQVEQIRKAVSVAPSNPTYLSSKKTNFNRLPELTSLKLG